MKQTQDNIVLLPQFILATRDSGYKNIAAALAELVDNSFEAKATRVDISIDGENHRSEKEFYIAVCDNGTGMTPDVLKIAVQFGGSTKFNSRKGIGRYGMGLPNGSLSQARCLDVYTWQKPGHIWWTYLDSDEIAHSRRAKLAKPKQVTLPADIKPVDTKHGTAVIWTNCDRLSFKKLDTLIAKLHISLGRIFREFLWSGKSLRLNGTDIMPIDPLYLRKGNNLIGAKPYGSPLIYEIALPEIIGKEKTSSLTVSFSLLPVDEWHSLSNEEKRSHGITKGAGMSILRAGREIDYGWFFSGSKRKENYDDWWRCEIKFAPLLDELFGVTHTKQGIRPTEFITKILSPDIERIAHELNYRVRNAFIAVKKECTELKSEKKAAEVDCRLEPPPLKNTSTVIKKNGLVSSETKTGRNVIHSRLKYKIKQACIEHEDFFKCSLNSGIIELELNEDHPFFTDVYSRLIKSDSAHNDINRTHLELILLAAARATLSIKGKREVGSINSFRRIWSNNLSAFLT